jgi:hypothetical protein
MKWYSRELFSTVWLTSRKDQFSQATGNRNQDPSVSPIPIFLNPQNLDRFAGCGLPAASRRRTHRSVRVRGSRWLRRAVRPLPQRAAPPASEESRPDGRENGGSDLVGDRRLHFRDRDHFMTGLAQFLVRLRSKFSSATNFMPHGLERTGRGPDRPHRPARPPP